MAGYACAESLDISFQLKEPGLVSVAVYDLQGKMFRELARGMRLEAGDHRSTWDGFDRYGQPAPRGEYEWRLLRTAGFTREFLVGVGTSPGWTAFDLWPGNHAGPTTLMLDAETNLYVGSISSEGPPHLLKMSSDGRHKFWSPGTSGLRDGLIGMARIGEVVYLLFSNGTLNLLRADTGTAFWGHPKLRKFPERRLPFADVIHTGDANAVLNPEERRGVSKMALAAGKNFLVVTYQKHDEVRFLWPKDDVIIRTNSVHLLAPNGCCVTPDGRVFVVSGKSIVRLHPERDEVQPCVTDPDLMWPQRVAYDPVHDDLLVLHRGAGVDNVRRYHAANGKLVASYGRPAGRTYGVFNPVDWGGLSDIVADGLGGFFTVEEFPRRVAHFRGRERYEMVAQWIGGTQWGALCALDPADPTIVYFSPDHQHCARGRVEYAARAWTLTHLYDLPEGFGWALGKERHRALFPGFGGGSYWEVRHVAGATFLVNTGRLQGGCAAVVRVAEQENRLVPVAILGGLHPTTDRTNPPSWWLQSMQREGHDPKKTGYQRFGFSWSDTNRDGRIDVGEIKRGNTGNTHGQAHCFVEAQWNVYYALDPRVSRAENQPPNTAPRWRELSAWLVVTNEGKPDLPVWNWDHARRVTAAYPASEMRLGATSPTGIFHDSQGNTYTVCNARVDWKAADLPPISWRNNTTPASRFQKWNPAGSLEWSVGLHTAAKNRPPGQFAQVRGNLGEVSDCLVVLDACEPASVWTRDGLFAGSLYGQRANDGLPEIAYNQIYYDDNHWGVVMETRPITTQESTLNSQPSTLDILWGGMSHNSTPIYRVKGWENWERQSGKLTMTRLGAAALWEGTGLSGEYFANSHLLGEPKLRRRDADLWFGPMWGDHREVRARQPWFSQAELLELHQTRQSGALETSLSPANGERTGVRGTPAGSSDVRGSGRQRAQSDQRPLTSDATVQGGITNTSLLSPGNYSARWTGFFEAPLSETFTFVVYTYGRSRGNEVTGSRVRLWVTGKLLLDEWEIVKPQKVDGWKLTRACTSKPIALTPGQRVPIRLEYAAAGGEEAHLHLFLESDSIDQRHVPQALLYPGKAEPKNGS